MPARYDDDDDIYVIKRLSSDRKREILEKTI